MQTIPGYKVIGAIEENSFHLYHAIRDADSFPVILKTVSLNDYRRLKQLENEYNLLLHLKNKSTLKPISLEKTTDAELLICEEFQGISLEQFFKLYQIDVRNFLTTAIHIAKAFSLIHENGIIHKDVKPENILINPENKEIKIINFDISIPDSIHVNYAWNPQFIEGSFPYISPEQTGRMNRAIDSRTDIYSLGITFYQMITGKLPFTAHDPVEWIYHHLISSPVPPEKVNKEIPKVISEIILKMISKHAEDRYQTMNGVAMDLQYCLDKIIRNENLDLLILGSVDYSNKLQISQKIYGREKEKEDLSNLYKTIVNTGASSFITISGYSGVGKTTLVNELFRQISSQHGFFITGKFDQYKRNIPFATIIEAFSHLISFILTEPEERINEWRSKIQFELGVNGKVITDLIPELELIIGKQPEVAELPTEEAKNRFILVLGKFIKIFSTTEHPLTIFLDDLQWADNASLQFMQQIIPDPFSKYIFWIGAYRDQEVYPGHPLTLMIDHLKHQSFTINEITLQPLKEEDVNQLIADSLRINKDKTHDLTALVYKKAKGNPFFTIQFLKTIYQDNLLYFNSGENLWRWNMEEINAQGYTENVLDFMIGKIRKLPDHTQKILMLASCIGNKFRIDTLIHLSNEHESIIRQELKQSAQEGLVITYDGTGKFLHDRIAEAVYSLIPNEERIAFHLKLGKLLLTEQKELVETNLFEIVNHLNLGLPHVVDKEEIKQISRLNLRAGTKAKDATAYHTALNYFHQAEILLSESSWKEEYDYTFEVYIESGECEYLTGNFKKAHDIFNHIISKANSNYDKAKVYRLNVTLHVVAGKNMEAINEAFQGLKIFGIDLPENLESIQEETAKELMYVKTNLNDKKIEDLVDSPVTENRDAQSILALASEVAPAVLIAKPEMFFLIVLKMVNYSLHYGHTKDSCLGYSAYSMFLTASGDIPSAQKFSTLSLKLNEKFKDIKQKGKLLYIHGAHINFWSHTFASNIPILEQSFIACLEVGDLPYAGFYTGEIFWQRIENGDILQEVMERSENLLEFLKSIHHQMMYYLSLQYYQFAAALTGKTIDPLSFNNENYNEDAVSQKFHEMNSAYGVAFYNELKLILSCIYENFDDANAFAEKTTPYLPVLNTLALLSDFPFFQSLALSGKYETSTQEEKNSIKNKIQENLKLLENWSSHCPENFLNRYKLILAEQANINGNLKEAMGLYDEAINLSRENKLIQFEALANEAAARFYAKLGHRKIMEMYVSDSYKCYERWGAKAKLKHLETKYPFIKFKKSSSQEQYLDSGEIDFLSFIKASQTISEIIDLNELSGNLIKILTEQAAADKAYLLISKDNLMLIASHAENTTEGIQYQSYADPLPYEKGKLPLSIIQFVKRTRDKVILDNATTPGVFSGDNYLQETKPKSVACIPLLRQNRLTGILYLENNQYNAAFTYQKIKILEMLASQGAISIENALLFTDLNNSRRLLQDTMDNSSTSIFLKDLHGRYIFVNHEFENIFQLTSGEAVGKTAYDILPTQVADELSYHDAEAQKGGVPILFEETGRNKTGELKTYISVRFPVFDIKHQLYAIGGILTDITDRKQAEEKLIEREAKIRRLIESNMIGILFWKLSGGITDANDAFLKIIGATREDLLQNKIDWNKLTPEGYKEADQKAILELNQSGTSSTYEKEYFRMDGTKVPVLIGATFEPGSKTQGIAFVLDLTELKKAHLEIERLNEGLKHQVQELTNAQEELKNVNLDLIKTNTDLDNFLYVASHNVKVPVANLEGIINMLEQHMYSENELDELIGMMKVLLNDFKGTISDLTEVSKVQTLTDTRDIKANEILSVVEDIKNEISDLINQSGADIETDTEKIKTIKFSALNFRRILYNLLVNALTFKSTLRKPKIFIKTNETEDYQTISVTDNGLGIADYNKEKIFMMFKKAHGHAGGRGIGLYIIRRIMENNGGKIEVESQEGVGSTFTLFFKKVS